MNVVIFVVIPKFTDYQDRSKMFFELANVVDEVYFISKDQIPKDSKIKLHNIKYINFNNVNNGIAYTIAASKYVYKTINILPRDRTIIIHDLFISRVGLINKFLFKLKKRKIYSVVSLYAANPELFIHKSWRNNNKRNFFYKIKIDFFYTIMLLKRFFFEWISCKFSDICIGNSKAVVDGVKNFYKINNKKIMMLPTSVDTNFFSITNIPPKDFFFKQDTKIILFVGRLLLRRKGIDTLFKAFNEVIKKNKNIHLILIGSNEYNDKDYFYKTIIENKISKNITIKNPINREELKKYYCAADIFISPSINEGSPRVLKEALACGIPAIVSDIPGHRIVDSKGEFLLFFPPGNSKILSEKIEYLLNDETKLKKIGERSREQMIKNFSTSEISKRLYNLYLDMIK